MSQPISTAEHKKRGTYQPCRHADRADGTLAIGEPKKPKMRAAASELWDTVLAGRPPESMAACDYAALELCCEAFAEWRVCMAEAHKAKDYKERHSAMIQAGMAAKHFATLAGQFGMTPAARTKLKIEHVPPAIDNPLDRILARRNAN